MANNSATPNALKIQQQRSGGALPAGQPATVQLTRMNQRELIDIYHDDGDFNKTIRMLDGIRTIEVNSLAFDNGVSVEDKNSSRGLTLPHESPPVVFINHNNFTSQEEVASTLYHEAHHAYDPNTPAKNDDSQEAMRQDFVNEALTQKIEAERALARGDQTTINALLNQGKLINGKNGPEVNEKRIESIANGNYSNYAQVSRSRRFDIGSYQYDPVAQYKPGSWSKIVDEGYEADDESR